ncbi:hypothetical protein Agub_g9048, partial [Astrephomene gubernaculifera]
GPTTVAQNGGVIHDVGGGGVASVVEAGMPRPQPQEQEQQQGRQQQRRARLSAADAAALLDPGPAPGFLPAAMAVLFGQDWSWPGSGGASSPAAPSHRRTGSSGSCLGAAGSQRPSRGWAASAAATPPLRPGGPPAPGPPGPFNNNSSSNASAASAAALSRRVASTPALTDLLSHAPAGGAGDGRGLLPAAAASTGSSAGAGRPDLANGGGGGAVRGGGGMGLAAAASAPDLAAVKGLEGPPASEAAGSAGLLHDTGIAAHQPAPLHSAPPAAASAAAACATGLTLSSDTSAAPLWPHGAASPPPSPSSSFVMPCGTTPLAAATTTCTTALGVATSATRTTTAAMLASEAGPEAAPVGPSAGLSSRSSSLASLAAPATADLRAVSPSPHSAPLTAAPEESPAPQDPRPFLPRPPLPPLPPPSPLPGLSSWIHDARPDAGSRPHPQASPADAGRQPLLQQQQQEQHRHGRPHPLQQQPQSHPQKRPPPPPLQQQPASVQRLCDVLEVRASIRRLTQLQERLHATRAAALGWRRRLSEAAEARQRLDCLRAGAERARSERDEWAGRAARGEAELQRLRETAAARRHSLGTRARALQHAAGVLQAAEQRRLRAEAELAGPSGRGQLAALTGALVGRRNRMVAELGRIFQVGAGGGEEETTN